MITHPWFKLGAAVVGLTVGYLFGSAVMWDMNPANWGNVDRYYFTMLAFLASYAAVVISNGLEAEWEKRQRDARKGGPQ